jgi:hypothetical protein
MSDQKSKELCSQFKEHVEKHLKFCQTCAEKEAQDVLFCAMCSKEKYREHKDHKDLCEFKKVNAYLDKLHAAIVKNKERLKGINSANKNEVLGGKPINSLLEAASFRKWLLSLRFWKPSEEELLGRIVIGAGSVICLDEKEE